jgi:SAM-dependent methyltransferase
MAHCTPGDAALDIGCNKGYFSRDLLQRGFARTVDAIEYDATIVPNDLKLDSRFTLYSGDALTFPFPRRYHTAIYGALHHHLFAVHGYSKAMRFWLDVVDHTESLIFIESGQLPEGSRWYWQRALREYYSSDEDYFSDLLFAIGPRLKTVNLIGCNWIHGVRRWLFKIELRPREATRQPAPTGESIEIERTYGRTIGSTDQELVSGESAQGLKVHEGIAFQNGLAQSGERVFCKKYLAKHKEAQEYTIGTQICDPRFVVPVDHTTENGLVFPFVDLPSLNSVSPESVGDRAKFRRELLSLFRFAENKHIVVEFGGRRELKLIDVIDLHGSNILYDASNTSFRVVDLEMYSLANRHRNRMHLAKILLRWCGWNAVTATHAVVCTLTYTCRLLLIALQPPERRAIERSGSVLGRLYVQIREKLDKLIMALLPSYRK